MRKKPRQKVKIKVRGGADMVLALRNSVFIDKKKEEKKKACRKWRYKTDETVGR